MDVGVWDYNPDRGNTFIGETLIELKTVDLEDVPEWHTLQKSIDSPLLARLKRRQSRASLGEFLKVSSSVYLVYVLFGLK